MKEIVIKQSQLRQFGLLILSIFMVVMSLSLIVFDYNYINVILCKVVGFLSSVFMGTCLVFIFKRFIKPKDILIINENGIIDNSSASAIGFIPWGYIDNITLTQIISQKFISLHINNLDKLIENVPAIKIKAIQANLALGYAPISITLNATNAKCEDTILLMHQYQNAYLNSIKG